MKSLITFGVLILFSVLSMSSGQGYVRLSRADPIMSLLLSSKDGRFGFRENGDNAFTGDNAAGISIVKRNDGAKKNFFDFIFRKFNDDEDDLNIMKKRNVQGAERTGCTGCTYRMLKRDPPASDLSFKQNLDDVDIFKK